MQLLAGIKKKQVLFFVFVAFLIGFLVDLTIGTKLDDWIHDSAVVFQHRTEWKYSGIVVLDEGVPFNVGRRQTLPLFAKATERLIEAGAYGVFLDARVSKEVEARMPYARCITPDGSVQWSEPKCWVGSDQQCLVNSSELGLAPLKMNHNAIKLFRIAPYLNKSHYLPDFLLFGLDVMGFIPEKGLVASDRLVTFNDPIARWVDLSQDHAVQALISLSPLKNRAALYQRKFFDEICNSVRPCRRIRLSKPSYQTQMKGSRLILPVSLLASCDEKIAQKTAALLKNKLVILQLSAPNEATDLVVTAMTTAMFGPKKMTSGAQYLLDEVETLMRQDSPIPPSPFFKILLLAVIAFMSVIAGLLFQQAFLWILAISVFVGLSALCFMNPIVQLWPVAAVMVVYFVGVGQVTAVLMLLGTKEGRLLRRYIPEQVRNLLMPLKREESFKNKRCHVVVLMSDLAGYTTVTGLLKDPSLVLELMNDYLTETSFVLQKKYGGILEAYVGDLVCYYWQADDAQNRSHVYEQTLLAAIELRTLQKEFFSSLEQRYKYRIDPESLQQISLIIDAGIAVSMGDVVMGDLGPEQGIRKFGLLGDPLNLAARIEGLTRRFSTDIIISGIHNNAIISAGLVGRRLGVFRVKGRLLPETLYAIGMEHDLYFEKTKIAQWEAWLTAVENKSTHQLECPHCYEKDKNTLNDWLVQGLLNDEGVWCLDNK
ncbi:MAG: adenylate/guanylate cyclase domain-containing protein [Methylococcales bacterium]|nr:adenylate/guanylate cyclase domain-containing protein [Methylococcales bacterium]